MLYLLTFLSDFQPRSISWDLPLGHQAKSLSQMKAFVRFKSM